MAAQRNGNPESTISRTDSSMTIANGGQRACVSVGGRMLATGGLAPGPTRSFFDSQIENGIPDPLFEGTFMPDTEWYDPMDNSWSPGPSMVQAHGRHSLLAISDTKVLCTGGNTNDRTASPGTEILDVETGVWTTKADMIQGV